MALKYAAKGAVITVGGTAIDGVQSLSVPSDSVNLIDVSSHDCPSGNGTTNDVHTFSAFVTGFSISLAFDGAETATVTLKRSGADAVTDSV